MSLLARQTWPKNDKKDSVGTRSATAANLAVCSMDVMLPYKPNPHCGPALSRLLDYNYFLSLPLATPAAVRSFEAFRRAALTADPAAAAAAGLEESVFMKPQVCRGCRGWGLQAGRQWRRGLRAGGWAPGFGAGQKIGLDWDGFAPE